MDTVHPLQQRKNWGRTDEDELLKILNRNKSRTYRQTDVNLSSTKNQYLNKGLIELRNSLSKKHRRSKYQRLQKEDPAGEDDKRASDSSVNIEVTQNTGDNVILKNIEQENEALIQKYKKEVNER